jgi:hypothetical protein
LIYYITRSYPEITPFNGGGSLMRKAAVEKLRVLGYKVIVVVPNYNDKKIIITDSYISIPYNANQKFALILEHLGIIDDYLNNWVQNSFKILKKIIKKGDILFSSSGDDLGTVILGYKLKKYLNSKFIINFRDPIYKSKIYGKRLKIKKFDKPHFGRENLEKKLLHSADLIITSSSQYMSSLLFKFPSLEGKLINNNYGYIDEIKSIQNNFNKNEYFEIIYGGNMGSSQSPQLLAYALKNLKNIKATFIGNYKENKELMALRGEINLVDKMSYENYLKYVSKNANAAFISLTNGLSQYCVPSKLYDYINLELPILGHIQGQAKEIIVNEKFGLISSNINELKSNILNITKPKVYNEFKKNICLKKHLWSMDNRLKEILPYIS